MTEATAEQGPSKTRVRWLRGLELDLRSLALFRILLGLCLIADLLLRLPQIDAFYTDSGVLPRADVLRALEGSWAISLHLISGQWVVQLVLFLATLVCAVGLTLGYRTRLSAAGAWALVVSMQVRNPLIFHAGDDLFRMLLFWSMLVPLNERFSLDRALNSIARRSANTLLSPATLGLMFQVCLIYWWTAAAKMHPVWLTDRTAVYYALQLDQFTTPLGKALLELPALLPVLTTATLVLEFFGPLLVLSPFWTAPLRLLAVFAFTTFHAGLGVTLHLGLFPWLCIAAWMIFLPGVVWDRLALRRSLVVRWPTWLTAIRPARTTPPRPRRRFELVTGVAAVVALILIEAALSRRPTLNISLLWPAERRLISLTQVGQSWRMFAPHPTFDDGWFVMEGITREGGRVDVWNGGAPTYAKPAYVWPLFRDSQWQKYLTNLRQRRNRNYRDEFGDYLCRRWNRRHVEGATLEIVYVKYMMEWTPPPGQPLPLPEKESVLRHTCDATTVRSDGIRP